ncbi:MAG: hypothetical protein IPM54_25690 [Polyangiaceae bacterium]|nr:hypothetical protein [Polyangiaceae bacterium]
MRKKRAQRQTDSEALETADEALRSLSRRYPDGLAQLVLRRNERIEHVEWSETQISARELRMDRVLCVRLAGGHERLVHGEWTDRLNEEVKRRVGEYHVTVAMAAGIDADVAAKFELRGPGMRPVESVLVVLRGRKKRWPTHGIYRTSPSGAKFCGVQFRIEPVYQRTVAELESRRGVFWLAFVPLAIDVDENKLRRVIERLRAELDAEDFDEMMVTMLVMARLKKDAPGLTDVIRLASQEVSMNPLIRFGLMEGRAEGRAEGLEKGLALAVRLFERRLGRPMTDSEKHRLEKRMSKDGPDKLGDVVLDLSRDELAAWLAPRKANKRTAV